MFKKTALAVMAALPLISATASADTILGVYAGVNQWQPEVSGSIGTSNASIDNAGLKAEDSKGFYIALEHPVPLVPNVMLKTSDINANGSSVLNSNLSYLNQEFMAGEALATEINLSHIDGTLYYEILDNWLNADIGLTLRKFDGHLMAQGATASERLDLNQTLPMLYAKGQIDLPFTGWSVKAEGQGISYSGDSVKDMSVGIQWNSDVLFAFDAGLEVGYRQLTLDFEDLGQLRTNMDFSGAYLSINAHF